MITISFMFIVADRHFVSSLLYTKVILKERESRRQKFLRDCMRNSGEEEETDAATDLTEEGVYYFDLKRINYFVIIEQFCDRML